MAGAAQAERVSEPYGTVGDSTLMTGLHLDAFDAVAKLRECASKIAERAPGDASAK